MDSCTVSCQIVFIRIFWIRTPKKLFQHFCRFEGKRILGHHKSVALYRKQDLRYFVRYDIHHICIKIIDGFPHRLLKHGVLTEFQGACVSFQ